jgi:hypothetical protein
VVAQAVELVLVEEVLDPVVRAVGIQIRARFLSQARCQVPVGVIILQEEAVEVIILQLQHLLRILQVEEGVATIHLRQLRFLRHIHREVEEVIILLDQDILIPAQFQFQAQPLIQVAAIIRPAVAVTQAQAQDLIRALAQVIRAGVIQVAVIILPAVVTPIPDLSQFLDPAIPDIQVIRAVTDRDMDILQSDIHTDLDMDMVMTITEIFIHRCTMITSITDAAEWMTCAEMAA